MTLTKLVMVARALCSRRRRDRLGCIGLGSVLRVGLDILEEGLDRAVALVVKEDITTSRLELDGGETLNAEASGSWEIVLGSLELGDHDLILGVDESLAKRLPDRSQALACLQ